MASRINWQLHKGRQLLHVDYSDLESDDDIVDVMEAAALEIERSGKKKVLMLSRIGSRPVSRKQEDCFKRVIKSLDENGVELYQAMLGISGVKRIVMQGVMRLVGSRLYLAKNEEAAKEWLAGR